MQNPTTLKRIFTHAAHQGAIKALASGGPYLASGGNDDLIHIYDLKTDKDLGFLVNPGEGTITSLHFVTAPGAYTPSHLLAGSADGTISVWRAGGGWECMKSFRGHRKEVTSIAPHPSGKLALTTSRDGSLRMWDLIKGRAAFTTKLETEVDAVMFNQAGEQYVLLTGAAVTLHTVSGGALATLQHPRRPLCMCWSENLLGTGTLITGSEDGSLRVWDAVNGKELLCIQRAHTTRIKAVVLVADSLVATASSDGVIKVWDLCKALTDKTKSSSDNNSTAAAIESLAEVQTRARVTVMCALDSAEVMEEKMKEHKQVVQASKKRKQKASNKERKQQQSHDVGKKKATAGNEPVKSTGGEGKSVAKKTNDETVSFIEDADRERAKKKQRQVDLNAARKEQQRVKKGKGKVKMGA